MSSFLKLVWMLCDWFLLSSPPLTVHTLVFVSYRPHVDVKKLGRNTKLVAEALARVIYNLTEKVITQMEKMYQP